MPGSTASQESGTAEADGPWGYRSVLVTGASGFIGRHLCRRLLAAGAHVHGVCRKEPDAPVEGVRLRLGDLADARLVQSVFRDVRPDVVYHLASRVSGAREIDLVLPTFRSNLESTVHVLTEATKTGTGRVVLAGSLEEPKPTDSSPVPASPYAASKWAAAAYGRMFHALYGTPVLMARLFMVYGPGQPDPDKLVPYVIRSLLRGKNPTIGSGTRPVDWIYVNDVVEGLVKLGTADVHFGSRHDLGSGTLTTIRGVVEKLEHLTDRRGASSFGARPDRPMEQVRSADVDATRSAIGWRPAVDLEEGLARTVAWYRDCQARKEEVP